MNPVDYTSWNKMCSNVSYYFFRLRLALMNIKCDSIYSRKEASPWVRE